MGPVRKLPVVDRIQGVSQLGNGMPHGTEVTVQYTDHTDEWFEVQMSFLDAMYLLNCLRAVQEDIGYVMPDDPFEPQ